MSLIIFISSATVNLGQAAYILTSLKPPISYNTGIRLPKLHSFNTDNFVAAWKASFFSDHTWFLECNDLFSPRTAVTSSVPQGLMLGQLLLIINIHDQLQCVFSSISLFANGFVIYREIANECDIHRLQSDLDAVAHCCDSRSIEVTFSNYKWARFSRWTTALQSYLLRNVPLAPIHLYKHLGVL